MITALDVVLGATLAALLVAYCTLLGRIAVWSNRPRRHFVLIIVGLTLYTALVVASGAYTITTVR